MEGGGDQDYDDDEAEIDIDGDDDAVMAAAPATGLRTAGGQTLGGGGIAPTPSQTSRAPAPPVRGGVHTLSGAAPPASSGPSSACVLHPSFHLFGS